MPENNKLEGVLSERGGRYGRLEDNALFVERCTLEADAIFAENPHTLRMTDAEKALVREGSRMIFQKLARALCGDPHYDDNWVDIAGYATQTQRRLAALKKERERENDNS